MDRTAENINVVFLGDLVGCAALEMLCSKLPKLREEMQADLIVVNGENAARGFGIHADQAEALLAAGVDVITSGNHIWQKEDILPVLDSNPRLLRPGNYPPGAPGTGECILKLQERDGLEVAVLNLQGRERMGMAVDCPFRAADELVEKLQKQTPLILLDFHAEDVREKEAMAHHLDGRVSAVVGTHTHVPTADERILPEGTAAVTDLGMCGPSDSVIGTRAELSIQRSLTQLPLRMDLSENPIVLQGVLLILDSWTGRASSIRRITHEC